MPLRWWYRELLARRAEQTGRIKDYADRLAQAGESWTRLSAAERMVLLSLEEDW